MSFCATALYLVATCKPLDRTSALPANVLIKSISRADFSLFTVQSKSLSRLLEQCFGFLSR